MPRPAVVSAPPATNGEVPWVMPLVEVGMVVLWTWNAGPSRPSPAIVLAVGQETLSLSVHNEGRLDHALKSGARHVSDPKLRSMPPNEGGAWTLMPRDERLNAMLAAFERDGGRREE